MKPITSRNKVVQYKMKYPLEGILDLATGLHFSGNGLGFGPGSQVIA